MLDKENPANLFCKQNKNLSVLLKSATASINKYNRVKISDFRQTKKNEITKNVLKVQAHVILILIHSLRWQFSP